MSGATNRFKWAASPSAGDLRSIVIAQSLFRGRRARRQLVKRKENAIYRANVAREIEKTEEDYVKNLNVVIEYFLKPLKQRMEDDKTEDAGTMVHFNSLFSDIQVIRNYNGNLLNDLRPRMKKWSAHQGIGDIFVQMSAFLKVYTQYVSRYNKAMLELTNYKKNDPCVLEMLKKISEKEEVGNQEINSFLIRPIQRIPRYRLLLKDLLKHTEEDHNDFQALSSAYKQVSDVAEFIEEKASEAERIGKLLDVQSRLLGNETSIAAPSRKYVREGRLAVGFAKDNKVKRERMVFLFNDLLVDTKPVKKSGVEVFKFKNSYHLVQLLPVILSDEFKEHRFGFALRADGDTVDVVRFFAASTQERDEWINDLNSLRQDINAKREHHNDLVLERAQKRALKAKLAFSERYRKTDESSTKSASGDGTNGVGNEKTSASEELKPSALLKGMSPRAPNRWEKEHQSRKEEKTEETGVKPQGHQSRWASRLQAHQERLRSLQGDESAQSASDDSSGSKEFADDAASWSPEVSSGSRRKSYRDKRASADLTALISVSNGNNGSTSSSSTTSNSNNSGMPESPPSPRKSGGLFSLLRKRDDSKRSRRNTMSGANFSGVIATKRRSPSWEKKSDEDSRSSQEEDSMTSSCDMADLAGKPPAEALPAPPKLTRKEKRSYRKTFSVVDVAQMSRLQRSWGASNSDTSAVAASLEKLMLQEQHEQKQQQLVLQQQLMQQPAVSKGESLGSDSGSGRRIRSAAYDKASLEEMMHKESAIESRAIGVAATPSPSSSKGPSPSSSPVPSRTKNPFAYLKKRGDDKEKEKERQKDSDKEKEKRKEREVVNINPIRGIHLIPTFAAAAAAAYHANNAAHGMAAPNVAPSPPSLELSEGSGDQLGNSSTGATIIVSPPAALGPSSARGLTSSQSMELDALAKPAAKQDSARKLRPLSMDLTNKKPDAIRTADSNGGIDEEWERRKKQLIEDWKKEDREREKLLKAAKSQMKKDLKKSARLEKKEKEKEIKDEKKKRKTGRKLRPLSMDFSRRRLDSLLQRMGGDSPGSSDEEAGDGDANLKVTDGAMGDDTKHKSSSAVHLRARPMTSRAESTTDRVKRDRSRSATGSAPTAPDHAHSTAVTTWMSAEEEEALTVDEIERRISDLKRLRERKLAAGSAATAATDGDSTSKSSRPKSGSRTDRTKRSSSTIEQSSKFDVTLSSDRRKGQSEEMATVPLASSSPTRTRTRSHTSSSTSSMTTPSHLPSSGSAITRSSTEDKLRREKDKDRERDKSSKWKEEKDKEREREKDKDRKEGAGKPKGLASRTADKRVRPVSMDMSGIRLSDYISPGGERSDHSKSGARTAAGPAGKESAKDATTKAADAAGKSRRAAMSSNSWDNKKEGEKEKERTRGGDDKEKERGGSQHKERTTSTGASSSGISSTAAAVTANGSKEPSEKRNSIVREREKEKEREKSGSGSNKEETRRENGRSSNGEHHSRDKDKEQRKSRDHKEERGDKEEKERSDRSKDSKEKEKERGGDSKEKESKASSSSPSGKRKGSFICTPTGLGANSSSPAGWEERRKGSSSSTTSTSTSKQRAESTS